MMSEFKKLDRVPSSDAEIRILIAPLTESLIEYNNIIMENTQESIQAGMERTKAELKRQGLGKSFESDMAFFLNGSLKGPIPIVADIDFEEFSQEVSDRMKHDTFIASQGTIDRMSGDVMNNIKDSYEQGYGIDKAAVNLQDVFEDMEDWELKRVARTEINGAQNLGAEATMRQLGIQYNLWRTAGDARVRGNRPEDSADHRYLNGQITTVGGRFSNGLTRPGDRNGPIKEWIQCRCALIPYLMPEGYAAPSMGFFYVSDLIKVEIPEPGKIPKPGTKPKPIRKPIPRIKPQHRAAASVRADLDNMTKDAQERLMLLRNKNRDIMGEWKRHWDAQPMGGTEEYKIWRLRERAILDKRNAITDEIWDINKKIGASFKEKIYISKKGYAIDPHIGKGFNEKGIKNVNKGVKEFSKLVDESVLWPEDTGLFTRNLKMGGRAFHQGQSIHITNKDTPAVVIHEMGHFLEEHSPGMHRKVMAFYDSRTVGEKAVSLGSGYGRGELTKKDKFIDKYMGKVYPKASEIVSMGLQYFYNDPAKLAVKDPGMFDFIYNLVRGI